MKIVVLDYYVVWTSLHKEKRKKRKQIEKKIEAPASRPQETSSQYVGNGAPAGQSFVTDPQYMFFWGTSELATNDQPLVRGLAYYLFLEVSTEVYVGTSCDDH
jgi:hypothetical protein